MHKYLLLGSDGPGKLKRNASCGWGARIFRRLEIDAARFLAEEPQPIVLRGRAMLGDVRTSFCRISTLATVYLVKDDRACGRRAVSEMLMLAAMKDWNPNHYLDTAEATFAMGIGYDYLGDLLSESERVTIREAIREKGVELAFRENWHWIDGYNNWVQVCHTGMTAGALSIAADYPELAERTVHRALAKLVPIMEKSYSPCGAYPEGPSYWGYGTDFNSFFIALYESFYEQPCPLADIPGFDRTGEYLINTIAPDGGFYTCSDCQPFFETHFSPIYLAARFNRPDYCGDAFKRELDYHCEFGTRPIYPPDRTTPLALFWADVLEDSSGAGPAPDYTTTDASLLPFAVHRSGNDADACYLALKGGSPSNSHGHMDGGSFFICCDGVRFATDLGIPDYRLEKQFDMWNFAQDSDRWKLFSVGERSHNIILIGGRRQNVGGRAALTSFDQAGHSSSVDATELYTPYASKVRRTVRLEGKTVRVCDHIEGVAKGETIRFQFCTAAAARVEESRLILGTGNQSMTVDISGTVAAWRVTPCDELREQADTPRPGLSMAWFEVTSDGKAFDSEVTFRSVNTMPCGKSAMP